MGEASVPVMKGPVHRTKTKALGSSAGFRAWLAGSIALSVAFALQPLYAPFQGAVWTLLAVACAGVVLISAFSCAKRYGLVPRTSFQGAWLGFTLGAGMWVTAEIVETVYYFILNVPAPVLTAADLFYYCGYLSFFAGLILYFQSFSEAVNKERVAKVMFPVAVLTVVALWRIIPLEAATSSSLLAAVDGLGFVLLDLLLVALAVLPLAIFAGGTIAKWLVVLCGGSALYALADVRLVYLGAKGNVQDGNVAGLLFLLAYLLFAFAFYLHRREW
jgi:hypothetical protein